MCYSRFKKCQIGYFSQNPLITPLCLSISFSLSIYLSISLSLSLSFSALTAYLWTFSSLLIYILICFKGQKHSMDLYSCLNILKENIIGMKQGENLIFFMTLVYYVLKIIKIIKYFIPGSTLFTGCPQKRPLRIFMKDWMIFSKTVF